MQVLHQPIGDGGASGGRGPSMSSMVSSGCWRQCVITLDCLPRRGVYRSETSVEMSGAVSAL